MSIFCSEKQQKEVLQVDTHNYAQPLAWPLICTCGPWAFLALLKRTLEKHELWSKPFIITYLYVCFQVNRLYFMWLIIISLGVTTKPRSNLVIKLRHQSNVECMFLWSKVPIPIPIHVCSVMCKNLLRNIYREDFLRKMLILKEKLIMNG